MARPHIAIIGGGLAGLSAGCYARMNGFPVTLIEHNLTLGGVCTAWSRAPYMIDGCIHWLTGGPFDRLYRELAISPVVELRKLTQFATYRHARDEISIPVVSDLDQLAHTLGALAPEDRDEITLLISAARRIALVQPNITQPPELMGLRELMASIWSMRHFATDLLHLRKPLRNYVEQHLASERLRQFFTSMFPAEAPALVAAWILGFLERGYLSRPVGGTARFRDALIARFTELGGVARTHTTVDEITVQGDRATGVRVSDGKLIPADYVISTSSMPETILRLLGGRYGLERATHKFEHWEMFDPIVLVSFGVERTFAGMPATLYVDAVEPFDTGGRKADHLYLRIYNDDPSFAPPGHTIVQAMLPTEYDYWATRNSDYHTAKQQLSERTLAAIERYLPGTRETVRMVDVATPLTYWGMARSWRGAYEGWKPSAEALFSHVEKRLEGLDGFFMAGQWVEPGGGIPVAIMSGRQSVQLICAEESSPFVAGEA